MLKKNALRNYEFILDKFQNHFGDIELSLITSENILRFMSEVSEGTKESTKKIAIYPPGCLIQFHQKFDRF